MYMSTCPRRNQQPLPCAQGYKHARRRRRRRRRLQRRRRRRTGQPPCPLADWLHTKHQKNNILYIKQYTNDETVTPSPIPF